MEQVVGWLELKTRTGAVAKDLVAQLALSLCRMACLPAAPHVLVDIHDVYDQIGSLEGADLCRPQQTEPPSKFKHLPLKGLWHKHWTQAGFMARNLANEMTTNNLKHIMQALRPHYGDLLKAGIPIENKSNGLITRAAVLNAYQQRSERQALTGQWIVYASVGGLRPRNIYQTLATQEEDADQVFARCAAAIEEFPELREIEAFAHAQMLADPVNRG